MLFFRRIKWLFIVYGNRLILDSIAAALLLAAVNVFLGFTNMHWYAIAFVFALRNSFRYNFVFHDYMLLNKMNRIRYIYIYLIQLLACLIFIALTQLPFLLDSATIKLVPFNIVTILLLSKAYLMYKIFSSKNPRDAIFTFTLLAVLFGFESIAFFLVLKDNTHMVYIAGAYYLVSMLATSRVYEKGATIVYE